MPAYRIDWLDKPKATFEHWIKPQQCASSVFGIAATRIAAELNPNNGELSAS
jgi:hypothetical protein